MHRQYQKIHHRTVRSKILQALRDEPLTSREFPGSADEHDKSVPVGVSEFVDRIDLHASSGGMDTNYGTLKIVHFLYGDDRRAIRKWIEVNSRAAKLAVNTHNNTIKQQLPEYLWEMLIEEWQFGDYEEKFEDVDIS